MSNYLYPKKIDLDELQFDKLDVEIGTAKFINSDFVIFNAGTLTDFSITVDRASQKAVKSISDVALAPSDHTISLPDDNNAVAYDGSDSYSSMPFHPEDRRKLQASEIKSMTGSVAESISGLLFAIMIKHVFGAIPNDVDYSQETLRSATVFFESDPTSGVSGDAKNSTKSELVGEESSNRIQVLGRPYSK